MAKKLWCRKVWSPTPGDWTRVQRPISQFSGGGDDKGGPFAQGTSGLYFCGHTDTVLINNTFLGRLKLNEELRGNPTELLSALGSGSEVCSFDSIDASMFWWCLTVLVQGRHRLEILPPPLDVDRANASSTGGVQKSPKCVIDKGGGKCKINAHKQNIIPKNFNSEKKPFILLFF